MRIRFALLTLVEGVRSRVRFGDREALADHLGDRASRLCSPLCSPRTIASVPSRSESLECCSRGAHLGVASTATFSATEMVRRKRT